jgi:hypothetical protein
LGWDPSDATTVAVSARVVSADTSSLAGVGDAAETGVGVNMGLGTDIRLGSNFSLTPFANYLYGSFDGGATNVLQAGLGVTWH